MSVIRSGQVLCAVGTDMLTTIGTMTSAAAWATFMALAGIGSTPYIALQAVRERWVTIDQK